MKLIRYLAAVWFVSAAVFAAFAVITPHWPHPWWGGVPVGAVFVGILGVAFTILDKKLWRD